MSEKITIKCAGCTETRTLHSRKVERCDRYSCGRFEFSTPCPSEGQVTVMVGSAAGGFQCALPGIPDAEMLAALEHVHVLRDAGLKRIGELN